MRELEVWQAYPSESRDHRVSLGSPVIKATGQRECPHLRAGVHQPMGQKRTPHLHFSFGITKTPHLNPPSCHKPNQAAPRFGASEGRQAGLADLAFLGALCQGGHSDCAPFPNGSGAQLRSWEGAHGIPKGGKDCQGEAVPMWRKPCQTPAQSRKLAGHGRAGLPPATAHTLTFQGLSEAVCGAMAVLAQKSNKQQKGGQPK